MGTLFKKAERKQAKIKLALIGPSGSGKTYSALLLAQGLGGKIVLIDTERGSGELYSDLTDYDYAQIVPPFTPEKFADIIKDAEAAGYQTLILDSLTHAWAGEGGVLDIHSKLKAKNSFTAWDKVNPRHELLVNTILGSSMNILATFRAKQKYVLEEKQGKQVPKKVGLGAIQRDGFEYEFTTVFDLMSTKATASKDRTGLFSEDIPFQVTQETGKEIATWLAGAAAVEEATPPPSTAKESAPPSKEEMPPATGDLVSAETLTKIKQIAQDKGWTNAQLMMFVKEHYEVFQLAKLTAESANNLINDLTDQETA